MAGPSSLGINPIADGNNGVVTSKTATTTTAAIVNATNVANDGNGNNNKDDKRVNGVNGNGNDASRIARAAFRASLEAKLNTKPPIAATANATAAIIHSTIRTTNNEPTIAPAVSSPSSPLSPSSAVPMTRARRVITTLIRCGSLCMAIVNFGQLCHSAFILSHDITGEVVTHVKDISRTTWSLENAAQRNWMSKWFMNTIYNEEEQLQMRLEASYRNFAILATPLLLAFVLLVCCARCTSSSQISSMMRSFTLYLACVSLMYQIYVASLSYHDAGGYVMIYIGAEPILYNFAVQTLAGFLYDWLLPLIVPCWHCCRSRSTRTNEKSVKSDGIGSTEAISQAPSATIATASGHTK